MEEKIKGEISAAEMRERMTTAMTEKVKAQLHVIFSKINAKVGTNDTSVTIDEAILPPAEAKLKSLGYTVKMEHSSDPREPGFWTQISW